MERENEDGGREEEVWRWRRRLMSGSMSAMKVVEMTTILVTGVEEFKKCAAEMVEKEAS